MQLRTILLITFQILFIDNCFVHYIWSGSDSMFPNYYVRPHEFTCGEHILFLLTSPIFFFFFYLLFCRKDCAKTIDRIKTKFSHNVPLMRLQRTSPFRNAHVTQRPLVAVLIFSTTNFLASIQQRLLIALTPNFNTMVQLSSHSERPLLGLIT